MSRRWEGDLCSVLINSPGIEYFWLWSLNRLCLWSKSWLMETLGRLGVGGGLWCVSLLIKVLCALSDAWDWGNGFSSVNGVICFGSSLFNPGVVVDWFILVVSFNSVVYAWLLSGSGWWIWWWFVDYFSCSSVFWWCDCDSLVNRMKWLWWRGGVGGIEEAMQRLTVALKELKEYHAEYEWNIGA